MDALELNELVPNSIYDNDDQNSSIGSANKKNEPPMEIMVTNAAYVCANPLESDNADYQHITEVVVGDTATDKNKISPGAAHYNVNIDPISINPANEDEYYVVTNGMITQENNIMIHDNDATVLCNEDAMGEGNYEVMNSEVLPSNN